MFWYNHASIQSAGSAPPVPAVTFLLPSIPFTLCSGEVPKFKQFGFCTDPIFLFISMWHALSKIHDLICGHAHACDTVVIVIQAVSQVKGFQGVNCHFFLFKWRWHIWLLRIMQRDQIKKITIFKTQSGGWRQSKINIFERKIMWTQLIHMIVYFAL